MRHLFVVIVCALGCSGPAKVPDPVAAPPPVDKPVPVSPELSPALAPLGWILGDWEGDHGSEHWIAAAGAIYGIGLANDGSFEVMIIDDGEGRGKPDGKLRFLAMPGGADRTQFDLKELVGNSVTFENQAHDFPKTIHYRVPAAGQLAARVAGGDKTIKYEFRETSPTSSPEVDVFDVRFAQLTAKRGIDGWIEAFAADGAMQDKGKRIVGHAAIAAMMGPVLASGKLEWVPIQSGHRGTVGFSVGKATFTAAKPEESWRSSYVSIWKQQEDRTWLVWFDVGRVVNE